MTSARTCKKKKLQYNYALMDKYLDFCEKNNRIISINKEPRLSQLAFVTKPKEIEPQREAFEKAKDEVQKLLRAYPEYVHWILYTRPQPMKPPAKASEQPATISIPASLRKTKVTARCGTRSRRH